MMAVEGGNVLRHVKTEERKMSRRGGGVRTPDPVSPCPRTPVSYTIATDDFLVHLVQINAVAEAI